MNSPMEAHVREFVETAAQSFGLSGPVYEFGFTTPLTGKHGPLQSPFAQVGYIGCGLHRGAEADSLSDLTRLPFADGVANTVVCVEILEHLFEPQQAMAELLRILAPGGAIMIAARGVQSGGSDPLAYWQPTARAVERLLAGLHLTLVGWQGSEKSPHTLYGIGFKPPVAEQAISGTSRFLEAFPERLQAAPRPLGWNRFFGWIGGASTRQKWRDHRSVAFSVHLAGDVDPSLPLANRRSSST